MPIGEFCSREVVIAERDCSVLEASRLMRQHHVGTVVIVEPSDGGIMPVGLVTDRDLVVEVMAAHVDPEQLKVGEIMTVPLCTVRERDGVFETMRVMRERGVRRVPVTDDCSTLRGIVAIDDLIALLAEEMTEVAGLIAREQGRETKLRK